MLLGLAAGAAVMRVLAGCMIDLDAVPSPGADAGPDAPVDAFVPPVADAAMEAGPAVECVSAADCDAGAFGGGCLAPSCNAGRCAYDLCPVPGTCQIARCNLDAGSCGSAVPLAFGAGELTLSTNVPFANLPCGALGRCVAAGYPFLFVVDGQDSVSGYVVADPKATTPRRVGVDRLDFAPAALVASGSRIYFVGVPSGALSDMRLPIGWFDVPANPFAASIPVTSVTVPYRASTADVPQLFAAPDGDLFLASGHESFRFHTGVTEASLVRPLPDVAGLPLVSSVGDRLVGATSDGAGNSSFGVLVNAGTPTAGFGGAFPGSGVLGPVAALSVAGGPAGEVVSLSASGDAGTGTIPSATKVRAEWLVEPGGTGITATAGVDLATFAADAGIPTTTKAVGPVAVVSAGAVTFRAKQDLSTIVELVSRRDAGAQPATVDKRSAALAGPPATYTVLTSKDWVYALSASAATLTVDVFRPSCDK